MHHCNICQCIDRTSNISCWQCARPCPNSSVYIWWVLRRVQRVCMCFAPARRLGWTGYVDAKLKKQPCHENKAIVIHAPSLAMNIAFATKLLSSQIATNTTQRRWNVNCIVTYADQGCETPSSRNSRTRVCKFDVVSFEKIWLFFRKVGKKRWTSSFTGRVTVFEHNSEFGLRVLLRHRCLLMDVMHRSPTLNKNAHII